MAWVKIDDSFADHPKVASAGPLGMALQVAALCYCNRYLTDGFVPMAVAPRLVYFEGLADPFDVINRLIDAGLWVQVEGGYQIHDYLEYQPSKSEVKETREKRRAAGAKGGQAKGKQRAKHDAKQMDSRVLSKNEAKSNPVPVPNTHTLEVIQTDIGSALHGDAESTPDTPSESVGPSVDDPFSLVTAAYHAHIGTMGPSQFEALRHWYEDMDMPADVIVEAILEAKEMGKKRADYVVGILRNWHNDGVSTVEEARLKRLPRGDPRTGRSQRESYLERELREAGVL